MTLAAKFLGEQRPELQHPSSDRFIGDVQPALGQQIFDIAEAGGKAKIQPHGVPDDVRRELVASERDLHRPSYPKERSATVGVTKPGYTVLQADGAAEALRQLDSNAEVDLLFTDIVMPETDGRKLAEEACKRRPSLEVLFTTGYTRNAIVHGGVLDPGVNLIVKPYSIEMLGRKLREMLDLEEKRKTPPSRSDYWEPALSLLRTT
jgi:CheY-like chemotaxis protein